MEDLRKKFQRLMVQNAAFRQKVAHLPPEERERLEAEDLEMTLEAYRMFKSKIEEAMDMLVEKGLVKKVGDGLYELTEMGKATGFLPEPGGHDEN